MLCSYTRSPVVHANVRTEVLHEHHSQWKVRKTVVQAAGAPTPCCKCPIAIPLSSFAALPCIDCHAHTHARTLSKGLSWRAVHLRRLFINHHEQRTVMGGHATTSGQPASW